MTAPRLIAVGAWLWGLAEATLFFIVPDVLLSYIGLKHGARASAIASLYAAIGAACGGVIMYLWSQAEPEGARAAVDAVPAIPSPMLVEAQRAMGESWFYATVLGPLTSTPYKVYAILAPYAGAPLWAFAIGTVFARLPRFLLVGLGCASVAPWLRRRLSRRAIRGVLVISWIVFYGVFFAIMDGESRVTLY